MKLYHASIEQLEKILMVKSIDRTPPLLITLDDTDKDKLSAILIKINELIMNSKRYLSEIAFINRSGTSFGSSDETIMDLLNTIMLTSKNKYQLQLQIEENVKSHPVGPYSDFFRSKNQPHNHFGGEFPESEIIDLIPATQMDDTQRTRLLVDFQTNTISTFGCK